MLKLTKFALKRPVTLILALVTIFFFGFQAVIGAKQELMPEMNFPMLVISTVYQGAAPEDVTELVTKKIEDSIATLSGVEDIYSMSRQNVSFIQIQYKYGTNMDTAYLELKKVLDRAKSSLPDKVDDPNIIEINMNMQASMQLIVGGGTDKNLYNYVEDTIVPELQKIAAVAQVDITGGRKNYTKIELIPEKLAQYKLNMQSISDIISSADFSVPAGTAEFGRQELNVNISADYKDTEKIKNIVIPLASGEVIHLSDIANVYNTLDKTSSLSRYNGEDVISLSIQKQQSASAVELSSEVKAAIDSLKAQNSNLSVDIIYDSADDIRAAIKSVFETLIIAVILSMIVLFAFFGNVKASLIVGSSIPVSVLMALTMMGAAGFGMNVISIGGLSLGVGMIVDSSIVVIESCFRAKEGRSFYEAAVEGTRIVLASIIGSTVTTCVVFLPLALLKGLSGQIFSQLGFTIVFCMVSSLIAAAMIVPLLFVFLRPRERENSPAVHIMNFLQNGYRKIVRGTIPRKFLVIFIAVVLLVLSFFMAGQLGMELVPEEDKGIIQISAKVQPGINIESADKVAVQIEDIVKEEKDVEKYQLNYTAASTSINSDLGMNMTVHLKKKRAKSTYTVIDEFKKKMSNISDAAITVKLYADSGGMSSGGAVSINLVSTDYKALKYKVDDIVELLRKETYLENVHSDAENAASTVNIDVDPVKAQALGLSPSAIGGMVYQNISGSTVMKYSKDHSVIEVKLEYPENEYKDVESVSNMMISTPTGAKVPLSDLASIKFVDEASMIVRQNKTYRVVISANIVSGFKGDAQKLADAVVDNAGLPSNISRTNSAYTKMLGKEINSLLNALLTAIFLIFIVMAMQFESPRFSFMVMFTIPFSLIGAFGLLYFSGVKINMTAMVGLLMLVGTVVNNGILYIDTVNQYREDMDVDTALVEAGATRLRPILMTTLTTVLSMLPLAFAYGDSGKNLQGLALVNVGGLMASTLLSLIMLPTLYKMIDRKRKKRIKEALEREG